MLSSRSRLLTVYDASPKVPVIESSNPKAPNRPRATVATWATKNVSPSWFFQGPDTRTGMAGSRSWITFANGGGHIDRGDVGGIWPHANDQRCVRSWLLRDREERGRFLIFSKREILSVGHDAHDLDGLAGAVLEIAAHGVAGVGIVQMEEASREFPIHNCNGRGLRSVGETYIASGKQRYLSGGKVSGRDP